MRTPQALIASALLIAGFAVAGYMLGQGGAPDQREFDSEYADAFKVGYVQGADRARGRSAREGRAEGLSAGRQQGRSSGAKAGADEGSAAAEAELARVEEERAAAEAAAAEAAELAIPAPCRGMPDSTARRMCIGAVEAGTYP
ncbi:MAG TPA: hypothetical protein VFS54_10990 [Solirubrobacterales bacterium]|nr:hypothetical protein [Solirubrobacterales bacterium]